MNKSEKKSRFLHRGRVDIIACILENAVERSKKTNLLYRCNLSLAQCNLYLTLLIEGGLLMEKNLENRVVFMTTERGRAFLNDYKKIKIVLDKMRDV